MALPVRIFSHSRAEVGMENIRLASTAHRPGFAESFPAKGQNTLQEVLMSKHNAQNAAKEAAAQAAAAEQEAENASNGAAGAGSGTAAGADSKAASSPTEGVAGTADLAAKDAEIEAYRKKIAELEGELSGIKEQYLRKAAEFENSRKRMAREKQDAIDFANQSLLLDLIPVIDDFERAIKSSEDAKNFESFHEGIVLIEKRLVSQLASKWNLVRYDSAGEPFDPNYHEAIMMDKSPDVSEPVVGEDFYKGYTLKDRVVRSAKVRVIMPDESAAGNSGESSSGNMADADGAASGEGSSAAGGSPAGDGAAAT